eukprot:jgi/Ulvmu1/12864/UM098_0049.1
MEKILCLEIQSIDIACSYRLQIYYRQHCATSVGSKASMCSSLLIQRTQRPLRKSLVARTASKIRSGAEAYQRLPMVTLITFDVDGTLIESVGTESNKLHKEAFAEAFKQIFDIDTHIDVIKHHGGTDPLVLMRVLMEAHGVSKEQCMDRMEDMKRVMLEYYTARKERAGDGLQLLPGVKDLMQKLNRLPNVRTALVTGNLEAIGWSKMEALGILDLFSQPRFGGFGSDFCSGDTVEMWRDRAEMIRIAQKKCSSNGEKVEAAFHVGDTPFDVLAAQAAGVVPVGVTTGVFAAEELTSVVPETRMLADLQGEDVLALFNAGEA